ncbi:hypothetical protein [Escherichia phage UPEC07]|nr:hypothetical protein [Escherichia phage UPEC07]
MHHPLGFLILPDAPSALEKLRKRVRRFSCDIRGHQQIVKIY